MKPSFPIRADSRREITRVAQLGVVAVVLLASFDLSAESLNDARLVQFVAVDQMNNGVLGFQYLNRVSPSAVAGGASISQRVVGYSVDTQVGMTSINRVAANGALRGTTILQNYTVGETSARAGWIQANDVTISGFGAPKRIVQTHSGASVKSTGWPIFINIYAN